MNFQDIIDSLLQKKANINAEKEARKAEALAAIDNEYAEQSAKIDLLLNECGYVEPVEEVAAEIAEPVAEVTEEQENAEVVY